MVAVSLGSPAGSKPSLWTVTVDVLSPEPSLCGVWDRLADVTVPGLDDRPAHHYFDDRGGVHAWAALRVRAYEADGARQRGQDLVDAVLSRAPAEVSAHRGLRVLVRVAPATGGSWETWKWLLAPRAMERLPRPSPWSHYRIAADGLTMTIVWTSSQKRLDRVDVAENPDRVMVTVHERHPPLLTPGGVLAVSRCVRRAHSTIVRLAKPLGRREVCDGFDAAPRTPA
ncbi:MAG TPA: hypothetical protein VHW26_07405 [Solirubrobacteraceae bacterium]|nr:hypothetical protein [Solirubrobacteraceae bacterium]